MSLINDALKQAKQSQTKTPPGGAPPLPPVEPPPRGGGPAWILVLAVILFIAAAVLFLRSHTARNQNISAATNAPEPAVAQIESPKPEPAEPPKPEPAQTNPSAGAATNANVEFTEQFPRIQGIFFDPAKPWAIVNRKTVHVGDQMGNYKIKTISRNSITFQRADGSTEEIKIGQQ